MAVELLPTLCVIAGNPRNFHPTKWLVMTSEGRVVYLDAGGSWHRDVLSYRTGLSRGIPGGNNRRFSPELCEDYCLQASSYHLKRCQSALVPVDLQKTSGTLRSSDADTLGATNPFRYFCQELR